MKALSWEAFLHQQSENKLNILFQRDYPYPAGNSWHEALIHLPLQAWAKLLLISLVQNQALIKSMTSFAQLLSLSASLTHRPDPLPPWKTQAEEGSNETENILRGKRVNLYNFFFLNIFNCGVYLKYPTGFGPSVCIAEWQGAKCIWCVWGLDFSTHWKEIVFLFCFVLVLLFFFGLPWFFSRLCPIVPFLWWASWKGLFSHSISKFCVQLHCTIFSNRMQVTVLLKRPHSEIYVGPPASYCLSRAFTSRGQHTFV